jgi:hypothetical protein
LATEKEKEKAGKGNEEETKSCSLELLESSAAPRR